MPSSLTLTPTTALLERLEQVLGPSCAAWTRSIDAHARDAGPGEQARELELCARACRFELDACDESSRALVAHAFTGADLDELARLADEHAPVCFAAHVAELAWLARAERAAAERAVDAYGRLATQASSTPGQIALLARALARATRIALELGAASDAARALASSATKLLELASRAGDVPLVQRCLDALESLGAGDPGALAALAIACAEREVAAQRDHRACALYRVAARSLARDSRPAEAQVLGTVRASVIAHVARRRRARGEPGWIANSFLRLALDDLAGPHSAPEFRARVERELAGADGARGDATIARAMHAFAEELDFVAPSARLAQVARLALEPREFASANRARPAWLEPVFALFEARSARGAGRQGWVDAARACGASVLEVARTHIASDPDATREAVSNAIRESRRIGHERAALWRRGLLACIEGDPLLGLALIVPQLDHVLRPRTLAGDGASAAYSRVFANLDAGVGIAARLLLYDREGWALCEQLASGALDPRDYSQENANLVLWLALRLLALDGVQEDAPYARAT